jgi:UDP-N-acetylmuramyl-tripeptide synthetase
MKPVKKLVRKFLPKTAIKGVENFYRLARGFFWQFRFGFPARGMRVVAITGTNGKSTTSAYINEIFKVAGYKTAMMTTPMMELAGRKYPRTTTRTLEKQSEVQNFFARAKKADVDWVILEVPSHALDQNRIMGIKVELAIVTNLTPEHLDYHKTMNNYARAKSLLLRNYGAKWAVLNSDDEWHKYFKEHSKAKVFSVGKSKAGEAQLSLVKLSSGGSEVKFTSKQGVLDIKTSLLGEFNLYNAAQAAAAGLLLYIDPRKIEKGIMSLQAVAGRFELVKPVSGEQGFKVFVDYAITPDSIENALKALQKITKGKVRIVFGATGDRDKTKRPLMGEAAGKNADYIYLTDDETYSEDSRTIIDAVYEGIKKSEAVKKTKIIADREQAIEQSIKEAKPGDSILITGLGHETTRNMGGRQIPWSDQEVAKRFLGS